MKNTIAKYFRQNRNPIGVLVAVNDNGQIKLGTSFLHPNDQFNKARANQIAVGRALAGKGVSCPVNKNSRVSKGEFQESLAHMKERAAKYFKDAKFAVEVVG